MKIKEGFIIKEVAGSYVVVPVGGSNKFNGMIQLNESGVYLWNKLASGDCTEQNLTDAILEKYDIDRESALRDVKTFTDSLSRAGILV